MILFIVKLYARNNMKITKFEELESIRNGTFKRKRKVARLVMETELQNKYREKRNLQKDIRSINIFLSRSLLVIIYNGLLHQIAVKSRIKFIKLRQRKKLHNLKLKQEQPTTLMNVNSATLNTPYMIKTKNTPLFNLFLIIIYQQIQKMLLLS